MTKAICVACGAMKFGVMLPCEACDFAATSPMDWAYAFAFSDHYIDMQELEAISAEMIRTGSGIPALDPDTEAAFLKAFGKYGRAPA